MTAAVVSTVVTAVVTAVASTGSIAVVQVRCLAC